MKTKLLHFPLVISERTHHNDTAQKTTSLHRYSITMLLFLLISALTGCLNSFDSAEFSSKKNQEAGIVQGNHSDLGLPHAQLAQLRAAVAPFHNFEKGFDAGYNFEATGYRTMMGFHYLNGLLVDDQFELENPEVLLYAPSPSGGLRLVAVEYVVPIADLDNPPPAPEGFSGDADVWVINTEFSMWTLHVWIGLQNPDGIFASHNPRLP